MHVRVMKLYESLRQERSGCQSAIYMKRKTEKTSKADVLTKKPVFYIFLLDNPCDLLYSDNQHKDRCDDGEKVPRLSFRELPDGARQYGAAECHWPLSIQTEAPAGLGANGFPHRYQRGGIRSF